VLPGRHEPTVGLRVPAHDFTRDVIARCGTPLWMTSVNHTSEPALCDPAAIEAQFGDRIAMLIDDGKSPLGVASTVVRAIGPKLEMLREGILTAAEVFAAAAAHVLFVCTGNTCRSPLAEAIARQRLAARMNVPPADLAAHGIVFASAGTGTMDGMPASDGSMTAAAEVGLDLSEHRSRMLDVAAARSAGAVYCMSRSHLRRLREVAPDVKPQLLRPDGREIADPFGGDLAGYRQARDEITAAIDGRLAEWQSWLAK
jgi:L-threonylcarbamoyladenylate synthase